MKLDIQFFDVFFDKMVEINKWMKMNIISDKLDYYLFTKQNLLLKLSKDNF